MKDKGNLLLKVVCMILCAIVCAIVCAMLDKFVFLNSKEVLWVVCGMFMSAIWNSKEW